MTMKSVDLDRRAFLSGAGLAAGAVVATSLVPLSVVHALPASVRLSAASECSETWHVDDVCGHWPPYSHPIGSGHALEGSPSWSLGRPAIEGSSTVAMAPAHADPVDHIYLI